MWLDVRQLSYRKETMVWNVQCIWVKSIPYTSFQLLLGGYPSILKIMSFLPLSESSQCCPYAHGYRAGYWSISACRWPHPWGGKLNFPSLNSCCWLPVAPKVGVESCEWALPPSKLEASLVQSCIGKPHLLREYMGTTFLSHPEDTILEQSPQSSGS